LLDIFPLSIPFVAVAAPETRIIKEINKIIFGEKIYYYITFRACLDCLIYWYEHLWEYLGELIKTTYHIIIRCLQLIFISSLR